MLKKRLIIDRNELPRCICGNSDYKIIYSGRWIADIKEKAFSVLKCSKCNMLRTYPTPKAKTTDKYLENKLINIELWEYFANRTIRIIEKYVQTDKPCILDIGASVGIFINLIQKMGWSGVGIDVDKKAIKKGKQKFKMNLLYGDLENNNFKDDSFDAIVLSHTLEHISDINNLFRKINKLLKNTGILIIEIPNIEGMTVRVQKIRKKEWYGYDPNNHIWHFTSKTIRYLLENNGLEILEINTRIPLYYTKEINLNGILRSMVLFVGSLLGMADQIVVVAKRKK